MTPALKVTRGLGARLRAGTAGGGGVSFGGVWTAVIVAQIALTVMLPSVALIVRGESQRVASFDVGFPSEEYLGVSLAMDGVGDAVAPDVRSALEERFDASLEALRRRVEGEPGVAGVAFVDALPRTSHAGRRVEVVSLPEVPTSWVATASVDPSYFEVLQAPVLSGRAFTSADLAAGARVVIVDQGFVDLVMSGRSPIGHRVRIRSAPQADSISALEPSYEIVGLVKDLGMGSAAQSQRAAGLYLPAVPGGRSALNMIVHGRGDPLELAPRVRALATAVDPALRVEQMTRLDQVVGPLLWFLGLWMRLVLGLTAVTLLLSLAGIYAVLSYTVSRRTREIGVRVALGSSARHVIASTFRRPLTQVALGVTAGSVLIAAAAMAIQNTTQFRGTDTGGLAPGDVALLAAYATFMLGVCLLACVVPTLRALRVQPTEAMRAE